VATRGKRGGGALPRGCRGITPKIIVTDEMKAVGAYELWDPDGVYSDLDLAEAVYIAMARLASRTVKCSIYPGTVRNRMKR
jgi:hypothetical protein